MQAQVAAQLGVEGERHRLPLEQADRPAVAAGDHLGAARVLDEGRADEDAGERFVTIADQLDLALEALQLAAVGVAADDDVHRTKAALAGDPVGDAVSEDDHPRAGAERRQSAEHGVARGVEEAHPLHQHRHRRRLTARDDQPVEPLQVFLQPHQACARAQLFEGSNVFEEGPLEGHDPNERGHGYQPREASSSSVARVGISMPTIGSPRSSLTSAMTSGLSK